MTDMIPINGDPNYQALVDELARICTCTGIDRPCDGLLAGGLCDDLHMEDNEND